MTREEAIKELKESLETLREYDIAHSSRLKQALEMAIRTLENHDIFMKRAYSQGKQDALSQEPCELPSAQLEIVRCGQCKYAEVADSEDNQDGYTCQFHRGSIWFSGSYCSWAEKKQVYCGDLQEVRGIVQQLPSVNPQPSEHFIDGVHAIGYREGYKDAQKQKSGKWLLTHLSNMAYCSECDYLFKDVPASIVEHFKHCPYCGAKMESEGKE